MTGRMLWGCVLGLAALASVSPARGQSADAVSPLPQAHAHNDYAHSRPLLDALDRGFCSVEADVFLVDGQLLVGHDRDQLRPGRTLQGLYLDPLRDRVRGNEGRVYPQGPTFVLLIDIKSAGRQAYAALRVLLASYHEMLCGIEDGEYRERAVQVVVSGDCPRQDIAADDSRRAGVDGRLSDLSSRDPAHLMPLISDRWSAHFSWRGVGDMPAAQRARLRSVVQQAHAAGRKIRFWATPESPLVWRQLLDAGVDYINTDQLDALRSFLVETAR